MGGRSYRIYVLPIFAMIEITLREILLDQQEQSSYSGIECKQSIKIERSGRKKTDPALYVFLLLPSPDRHFPKNTTNDVFHHSTHFHHSSSSSENWFNLVSKTFFRFALGQKWAHKFRLGAKTRSQVLLWGKMCAQVSLWGNIFVLSDKLQPFIFFGKLSVGQEDECECPIQTGNWQLGTSVSKMRTQLEESRVLIKILNCYSIGTDTTPGRNVTIKQKCGGRSFYRVTIASTEIFCLNIV